MTTNTYAELAPQPENAPHGATRPSQTAADAMLEFGRFRVLLRQRRLVADGVPIELGTRAFELLLALLDAEGALVTKGELMSRVWPGIFVAEDNLKIQILKLRRALGDDRNLIRTEFGRGYRFTAAVHATTAGSTSERRPRRRRRSIQRSVRRSPARRLLRKRRHWNPSAENRATPRPRRSEAGVRIAMTRIRPAVVVWRAI
jgi:DNA-binding winged helix-turn-helix (wHTH) protein